MTVTVTVVIKAAPGKADRIQEVLSGIADYVKANEPGTLRYELHKESSPEDASTPQFVVLEEFKDADALALHRQSDKYKGLFKAAQEESLLSAPPIIVATQSVAGFAAR